MGALGVYKLTIVMTCTNIIECSTLHAKNMEIKSKIFRKHLRVVGNERTGQTF